MATNGHIVLHVPDGEVTVGNGSQSCIQSTPLPLLSVQAGECKIANGKPGCRSPAQPPGNGDALGAEWSEDRSISSKSKDAKHPFFYLTRRVLSGKTVAKVSHAQEPPDTLPRSGTVKRQAFLTAIRKDKKVIIVPLLLMCLCMGLGLWGVFAASAQERRQRLTNAQNRAADKAQTIESELRACYLPVKIIQSFVARYPYFPTLNATFDSLASELLSLTAAGSISNMQLAPLGVVSSIYPLGSSRTALGHDLLADPKNRDVALSTIASHNLTLAGPYMLVQGFMGVPARFPIFVPGVDANQTFGMPRDATNCSICYDPATRTKFWGFATVLIEWDSFINSAVRIGDLREQGLRYRLTRVDDVHKGHMVTMAGSSEPLADPVQVEIPVPNNAWCLYVVDSRGWTPTWQWPLVAMVIVMSILLAALVGLALVGRTQQHLLLREVLSANQQLEDAATVLLREKDRMEALLQRQYDLIECLGLDPETGASAGASRAAANGGGAAGGANGAPNGAALLEAGRTTGTTTATTTGTGMATNSGRLSGERHPLNPAEQIEEMRKKLLTSVRLSNCGKGSPNGGSPGQLSGQIRGGSHSRGSNGAGADIDLVLGEMIGEGTFGKVYRGLWRGTEVAVKTIILPTNMSGKEKREKMAVMEAAISSSLAHPNVVATYTYQIKPLKDSSSSTKTGRPSDELTASAIIVGNGRAATDLDDSFRLEDPLAPFKDDLDEAHSRAAGGIHSYEVQLVLEYCDMGCLREALDGGIFFGQTGLNFAAILDTAADVAKALLHLHINDVLHGDLKADNVMLKSSGGRDGRGLTAKVADFGLAIKMDHLKTHVSATFQGTLTHMAPEVLLHGQMSKAADVYAFGVTLWEMFTSGYPYQGVPGALLGHLISKEGRRPDFPVGTPSGFRELAERCWHADAAQRPGFDEILATLTALRATFPLTTPALSYTPLTPEQRRAQDKRRENSATLRAKLAESARQSTSAPLPRLHHHFPGRKGSGSGSGSGAPPPNGSSRSHHHNHHHLPQRTPVSSMDGSNPRVGCSHSPRCGGNGGGGGTRRGSRARAKGEEVMIMVGGRNVSLSNAITSKSVVLEPICETRNEGDPDASGQEPVLL